MAVYERRYKVYDGPLTPAWSRFLVVTRYALKDVFRSRLLIAFLALCSLFPIVALVIIYFRHNTRLLEAFDLGVADLVKINEGFFLLFMNVQGWLAFFLVVFVGPSLISRDLSNNALPLYLSRPFTRREYVLGKSSVLMLLLSVITWIPALILWVLQVTLEGREWLSAHGRILPGFVLGFWTFILVLTLLALAISSWVRWRFVAGFLLLTIYLSGGFFALVIEQLFDSDWGQLLNLRRLMSIEWAALFGQKLPAGPPAWIAVTALVLLVLLSLGLLHRRIRAYEVVS